MVLVRLNDEGVPVTTSVVMAEYFEIQHSHLVKGINTIMMTLGNQGRNFRPSFYIDSVGYEKLMYEVNHDGFQLLVAGFTGERAREFKRDFTEAFDFMKKKRENAPKFANFKVPFLSGIDIDRACESARCQGMCCEDCLFARENFRKVCEQNRAETVEEEFHEFLEKHGAETKYYHNLMATERNEYTDFPLEFNEDGENWLSHAFLWKPTDEGHDYWEHLAIRWEQKLDLL